MNGFLFGNNIKSNKCYGLPKHTNFGKASPLFDGVDSRTVFQNTEAYNTFASILTGTADYTLSGWFFVSGSTGLSQCIFSNDQGTMGNGFMATYKSTGNFVFQVRSVQIETKAFFSMNEWHHFIVKKIGGSTASNVIKIDGIKREFISSGPTNERISPDTQITVGALSGATGPSTYRAFFYGHIDDLYWINRITTDKEDEILFNDFLGGFPPTILSSEILFNPKFDEVSGVDVIDSSPNNNTGTISNMTNTNRVSHFTLT